MKNYLGFILFGLLALGVYKGCSKPEPAPPPTIENYGWEPDTQGVQEFLETLPHQEFQAAAPDLKIKANEPVFLYRALPKDYPFKAAQGIGDCVSWGHARAVDILLATDFKLGLSKEFKYSATESLYGGGRVEGRGRPEGSGGWGDGSYGAAQCKWLLNYGVIYREIYNSPNTGEIDLRTYSKDRAKQWGNYGNGGKGDKGWLDNVARNHPVKSVAPVRTWEDLVKAIQNGYPVTICSNQGFTRYTDSQGFCQPAGTWNHCMVIAGIRFDREGALIINSWGNYCDQSRGKYPHDQPIGSFWADKKVIERILSQGDSWAISGVKGFPPRQLHVGW